jgi:hypothetical protein
MGRSLRFRVCGRVLNSPCSDSLSLRLRLSRDLTSHATSNSPDHNAKGTQSGDESPSYRLQAHGFRICFTRRQAFFSPFPHGTGALSVTDEYLALEGGPPRFRRDSSCPAVLRYPGHLPTESFAYGALTLSGGPFQAASARLHVQTGQAPPGPCNPGPEGPVWAPPRSLAATGGISFDFSSWGYLDVSVLPVGSSLPMHSAAGDET